MKEGNTILIWWNSLEKNWQDIFEIKIKIILLLLRVKSEIGNELTVSEKKLIELKDDFASNDSDSRLLLIINLLKSENIIIGRKSKFIIENLNPLLPFKELKEVSLNNCIIRDLSALEKLQKLKKLEFHNVEINSNVSILLNIQNGLEISFEKCKIRQQRKK